jgi:methionyl-tRNA formyltransferase
VTDSPVKALARQHQLPVLQPQLLRDPAFIESLRALTPDLGVVAAYGKLIPEEIITLPRLGMINVHASLLPKYRGAAPVHRAVIDGAAETGVTIMRVEKLLDAGAMLAKVTRPIGPDDTSDMVERDLAERGAELLVRVVDQMVSGRVTEEPQDSTAATFAPRLTKEEGLIDWTLPASDIHNRVRGLYPWPHAYTYLHGKRIIVLKARVDEGVTDAAPGTVTGVTHDRIQVAAGHQGRIAIETLQPEGRRPMSAREFLAGHAVTIGSRFTDP